MPEVQGVNINLNTIIAQIAGLIEDFTGVPSVISAISADLTAMATDLHAELEGVRTDIADLQATLGVAAGGPTTTVASLLLQVAAQTACVQMVCGPGPDDAEGCIDPLQSSGMAVSDTLTGRTYASWLGVTLTPGLTAVDNAAFPSNSVELTHATGSGWKAFVKSNAAHTWTIDTDAVDIFPTNQWVDISSNEDMLFSVPGSADIQVFICDPSPPPFVDCIVVDSQAVTYYDIVGSSFESLGCQGLIFTDVPEFTLTDTLVSGTEVVKTEGYVDQGDGVITNNTHNWSLALTAGTPPITVIYVGTSNNRDSFNLNTLEAVAIVPIDTVYLMITNVFSGGATGTPFSVRICPPA